MPDTPEAAYEMHLELVTRANEFLRTRRPKLEPESGTLKADAVALAQLRREISEAAGHPMIMHREAGENVAQFVTQTNYLEAAQIGTATTDYVVCNGPLSMVWFDVAD